MDRSQRDRGVASLVHLAFLASIGVFGLVFWVARRGGAAPLDQSPRPRTLAVLLLALGLAEISWAGWLGRRQLSRGSGDALARVRSFFFLRFGAAEAVAVFGLMLGFAGGGAASVALLFAVSAAALLFAAPSRDAWASAMSIAAGGNSSGL